ncbi:hypothetical protein [Gimesia maris]|uniref:hypothetical protein n=1 Tax=Gimesia maris TaxID=122 RepID=UPI0032EA9A8B
MKAIKKSPRVAMFGVESQTMSQGSIGTSSTIFTRKTLIDFNFQIGLLVVGKLRRRQDSAQSSPQIMPAIERHCLGSVVERVLKATINEFSLKSIQDCKSWQSRMVEIERVQNTTDVRKIVDTVQLEISESEKALLGELNAITDVDSYKEYMRKMSSDIGESLDIRFDKTLSNSDPLQQFEKYERRSKDLPPELFERGREVLILQAINEVRLQIRELLMQTVIPYLNKSEREIRKACSAQLDSRQMREAALDDLGHDLTEKYNQESMLESSTSPSTVLLTLSDKDSLETKVLEATSSENQDELAEKIASRFGDSVPTASQLWAAVSSRVPENHGSLFSAVERYGVDQLIRQLVDLAEPTALVECHINHGVEPTNNTIIRVPKSSTKVEKRIRTQLIDNARSLGIHVEEVGAEVKRISLSRFSLSWPIGLDPENTSLLHRACYAGGVPIIPLLTPSTDGYLPPVFHDLMHFQTGENE